MRLQDFDKGERYVAQVVSNQRITSEEAVDDVRELVLTLDNVHFDYQVGQSIGVIVPGSEEIGHPHHFRLYTLADTLERTNDGKPLLKICVKRCNYIDQYSGEEYQGIASNYLCDLSPGQRLDINGPFGSPFSVPADKTSDLLLIGMGTGIAPFRAFVKHLYLDVGDWTGRVRLFHGARSGLELLYRNDHHDDFSQFYDEQTFEAFQALSPRAHWSAPIDLAGTIEQRAQEVLDILSDDKSCVYVAGRNDVQEALDKVFGKLLGSDDDWQQKKQQLTEQNRWMELIY